MIGRFDAVTVAAVAESGHELTPCPALLHAKPSHPLAYTGLSRNVE
jgi:hypothetical protein